MGLLKKLRTPVEEHDRAKLADFCTSIAGATPIAEVQPRSYVTVVGEISSVRIVPKTGGSPWLEATIKDGTGAMVAMWTGRRRMPGIRTGRRLKMSGRGAPDGAAARLKVLNPEYELL
ncbi:MAG TPA: OB-fold nucleic acid binding domain-containing protein [Acidimicrobiales bacterium]|nr:OB-fold nucleic acid binding domain-containing protein [Acidimicrobiales bacterium]